MKNLHIIIFFLVVSTCATAQNNITKTAGINYTNGIPTIAVTEKSGSEIAIDTVTGYIYQYHRTAGPSELGGWRVLGQGIDVRVDNVPPAYTPFRNQSWFVINADYELYMYSGTGTTWTCLNCGGGGGGGSVLTDATLSGDGTIGDALSIAQQSAAEPQILAWTGATWVPSWGNPYTFVTTGATITTDVNEILVGTVAGDITFGLPACSSTTDQKHFKFVRNGTDSFSITIDPSSTQTFYDGTSLKISYGNISIDCTCRFSGGTGVWFFDNF